MDGCLFGRSQWSCLGAYCRRMRHAYRVELDEVRVDLARLARRAGQMMTDASTALWRADLPLAESVVSSSSQITTALCPDLDHRFVCLLASHAPVAPERRLIVAAMDAVSHLGERNFSGEACARAVHLGYTPTRRQDEPDGCVTIGSRC